MVGRSNDITQPVPEDVAQQASYTETMREVLERQVDNTLAILLLGVSPEPKPTIDPKRLPEVAVVNYKA